MRIPRAFQLRWLVILVAIVAVGLAVHRMIASDFSIGYGLGYLRGASEAKAELRAGRVCYYTAGLRSPFSDGPPSDGIPIKPIAGCMVDDSILGRLQGHNRTIEGAIAAGFKPANSIPAQFGDPIDLSRAFAEISKSRKPLTFPEGEAELASPDGRGRLVASVQKMMADEKAPERWRFSIKAPGQPLSSLAFDSRTPPEFVPGPPSSTLWLARVSTIEKGVCWLVVDVATAKLTWHDEACKTSLGSPEILTADDF